MRLPCLLPLFATLLLASPVAAQEAGEPEVSEASEPRQIYGYVDPQGAWHFVDSLALVPVAYRAQARGNAVGVLAPSGPTEPEPRISRRVVLKDKDGGAVTPAEAAAKRRQEITTLRGRRIELLEAIAALEEGSAPARLADENADEALTAERLEEYLTETEEELDRIDATLLRLESTYEP